MASIYANLLEQKKTFAEEKNSTPRGLVWDTNMAAVLLLWDTNMAAGYAQSSSYLYPAFLISFHTMYCMRASLMFQKR